MVATERFLVVARSGWVKIVLDRLRCAPANLLSSLTKQSRKSAFVPRWRKTISNLWRLRFDSMSVHPATEVDTNGKDLLNTGTLAFTHPQGGRVQVPISSGLVSGGSVTFSGQTQLRMGAIELTFHGKATDKSLSGTADMTLRALLLGAETNPAHEIAPLGGKMRCGAKVLVAVLFYSMAAPYAYAQRSFEVTPFFGSRFGGLIDETTAINPTVSYDHILIKSSLDYGGLFDYTLVPNLEAEFMFNRQPTVFTGHDVATNARVNLANGSLDEYEWGLLYAFRSPKAKMKPYIVGGLGFTHFYPSVLLGFSNRLSENLGAGVKYFFFNHFGLRFEMRWSPTDAATGTAPVCTSLNAFPCYQSTRPHVAQQGQVNLGLVLRFR